MKVLVVSTPGGGHVTPIVPLIDALLAGGDEVLVASGPEAEPIVAPTGARFVVAGCDGATYLERLARDTDGRPGAGVPPERILHHFLPRAFGRVMTDGMIDDVVRTGRTFAPDLIVHEAFALAAPLAADILGVPCVAHMFGPLPSEEAVELANDAVAPIWESHGHEVPGWAGMYRDLTIQICPPSIETANVPVGDTLYERPTPLPLGPPVPTDRSAT